MTSSTSRAIVRWIHILFAMPIVGYIYGPPEEVLQYAPLHRYFFVPMLVVTGLWLWKGHVVRRLFSKSAPASG